MSHPGFRQVEKDEFFKAIGPLNVHPSPQGMWSNEIGYLSHWKMLSPDRFGTTGEVVGLSDDYNNGAHAGIGGAGRYWLKESRFPITAPSP